MPEGMFLRSGPDWHFDPSAVHTLEAYLEQRGIRLSWKFVDPHVEQTLRVRGYWRNLPGGEQKAITRRFWEVGRLALEHWLAPRLDWDGITRWPGAEVIEATPRPDGQVRVLLANGVRLDADRVVFATGYRADLSEVAYLAGVGDLDINH